MQTYPLFEDYLTLGQLLKELGLITTGGQAKRFLAENDGKIFYNKMPENRRGKKLRDGDLLELPAYDIQIKFVQADSEALAQHEAEKAEKERVKVLVKKLNAEVKKTNEPKKTLPNFPGSTSKRR